MSIQPINNHILIEPLKHESFMASEKGTYEEVGIVKALNFVSIEDIKVGDKVWFDSWLAAKYPTGKGEEFFWLVRWEDVRAIEKPDVQDKIPE